MTAPARHRRLLLIVVGVQVMLVWPVYALIPARLPMVLGLPFSFAWLAICILIAFLALFFTFRADMREAEKNGTG